MATGRIAIKIPLAALVLAACATGQVSPDTNPTFDVASVKPSARTLLPDGSSYSEQRIVSHGRFHAVNSNLDECLRWAYQVEDYAVFGPAWLKSNQITFDIDAVAPPDTPPRKVRLMLRQLLHERFGVVLHHENRTMSVYLMAIDNKGIKLRRSELTGPGSIELTGFSLRTEGTTMPRLAAAFSREMGRPVLNRTGLDGVFAIDTRYASMGAADDPSGEEKSIFSVFRSLGLALTPARADVEVLVVERANQTPTPN